MWFGASAVPRALAAQRLLVKTFRATPRASAATPVRASSGRIAAVDVMAVVDALIVADAQTGTAAVAPPTARADSPLPGGRPGAGPLSHPAVPPAPHPIAGSKGARPPPLPPPATCVKL